MFKRREPVAEEKRRGACEGGDGQGRVHSFPIGRSEVWTHCHWVEYGLLYRGTELTAYALRSI